MCPGPRRISWLVVSVVIGCWSAAVLAQSAPPLTAAQQEKLLERDRRWQEAEACRAAGKFKEAMAALQAMLAVERAVWGDVHEDVAATLRQLAELHAEDGAFPAAETEAEEALAIQTKLHGAAHWTVADARYTRELVRQMAQLEPAPRAQVNEARRLSNQVIDLALRGKSRDALKPGEQGRQLYQHVLGAKHRDHATCLNNLGVLHHSLGDYRQAEPLYRQALDLFQSILGEQHPDYVTTFTNLAVLHGLRGEYAQALPLYRQALALRKQCVGDKHPDYVRSVNNLAWLHKARGEYGLAEPLYLEALHLHRQKLSYGRCNGRLLEIYRRVDLRRPQTEEQRQADLALLVSNLAVLYHETGDYVRAEPLYRQALDIYKVSPGEKSAEYSRTLNNLAGVHQLMGDYARAEPLYQQAVALRKEVLGEAHPDYAASLHNLGRFYEVLEEYDRAEPLFLQALDIRKKTLGVKHPYYAQTLDKLARLYHLKKDYPRAEKLYAEALEVRTQALGERHRYDATIVTHQALLYQAMGNPEQAAALFQKSLEWTRKEMGEQNQEYARTLYHLAMLEAARGKHADALRLVRQSVHTSRTLMERCAAIQSERQQLAMAETTRYYLDGYLTLTAASGAAPDEVYAEVLAWKGAVTSRKQTMRQLRRTLEKDGPTEALKLFGELEEATRRLATLSQAAAPPQPTENRRQEMDRLSAAIERLEQALAGVSETFRQGRARQTRTAAELARALPANAALIDLLEYDHVTPPPSGKGEAVPERRLAAFVLRRDQPLVRVDLGLVTEITRAVDAWRQGMVDLKEDAEQGQTLRRLLWEPLAGHLQGAGVVLLSPDGTVGRLPWSALPGAQPGSYQIEACVLAVVPVPAQLPEMLARAAEAAGAPSLLLVGDVHFDAPPGIAGQVAAARSAPHTSRGGTVLNWRHLPGTHTEIGAIRQTFQQCFAQGRATDLRQHQATEEEVRRHAPRHSYLHLATHGFFAHDALAPAGPTGKRSGMRTAGASGDVVGFHPGLLSGLVLAGANLPVQVERDDGILTALEVAELDLSQVELTVLSACETGLGALAGGEGLLGLQRAFHTAGARTTVASLWKVDDAATQKLMTRFYENLWQKQLPKVEALRQAQLSMLHEEGGAATGRGLEVVGERPTDTAPRRPQPWLWAAWVLSGDPGDLSLVASRHPAAEAALQADRGVWAWCLAGGGLLLVAALVFRQRRRRKAA